MFSPVRILSKDLRPTCNQHTRSPSFFPKPLTVLTLNIPHAYNRHGFEATRALNVRNNFTVGLGKRQFPPLGCAACGKNATDNSEASLNTTLFHV